ncbi:hypothetical protein KIP88_02705 [Bradyrhizobium sp. SRL28]|uniref:phage baseplate assembly protein n=1 Tax=Bradyrhizobium sp. SRL28 TaxID=2836178 RepID=UPI001BDEA3FC|nr:hypothetical protein [Bradyrhizobium sp. SRL28]MBT1509401.1 hypothetical protein [Bradyrhizobium sp. SRL28]
MPNPQEVAQLILGSLVFEDWETVWVQHRWQQAWPMFKFSSTEGDLPMEWAKLQFKPGDPCEIMLGGQLAVTGIITNRQVAYTSTEHGIQLSGVGKQWGPATSSVPMSDNKNNFDNKNAEDAIRKAITQVGGQLKVIGEVDKQVFERLQAHPGELTWDLASRIARMGCATMGTDHLGNFLLIGEHAFPVTQQLTEGDNILKMQCVFSNEQMYNEYALTGQFAVSDEKTQRQSAEMRAKVGGVMDQALRYIEIVTDQPVKSPEQLQRRANYEALQADGTQVVANVTVQGWLRNGVDLWHCGDLVYIKSPMCPLDLAMKIQTATFAQDSRAGTTTLLECVLPWKLGQRSYQGGNAPGVPQPPAEAMPDFQPGTSAPVLPPELQAKG